MHKHFMLAALDQARLGRGSCAPNPSVGAVAVYNGEIIDVAWHQGPGTAHAEQLVLKKVPPNLENLVLYVTLEPCNHWGRTPPCVEAILAYGVKEVIYAYKDPNPLVSVNNTPKYLEAHGIKVMHLPLREIDDFYQSYHYWINHQKPWITVKLAQSLDAKIAKKEGERLQLSNSQCAEFTHVKRLESDVILTTARTIQIDNPELNVRLNGKIQAKPIAIIDRNLSLDSKAKIFETATHCSIYYDENIKLIPSLPNCSYYPVALKNGLLDLSTIIKHLGSLGYHDVWVEAGGRLFSNLHKEKLVQRTYLYIVPQFLGAEAPSGGFFENKAKMSFQIKKDNVIACFDWQEDSCLQEL